MFQLSIKKTNFLIIIGAVVLFVPFLWQVHLFDWDEINFAEAAREMVMSGNYARVQIDFQPFWEKPPLFFWIQALSMNIFGVNSFAARFPNAVVGIITLLVIFYIGRKVYNKKLALIWVLAYTGSFLPHFYFKSGIIDPLFNLFIFLSIYQMLCLSYSEDKTHRNKHAMLGGLFIGLAILTKGPVAIFLSGLCILVFWIKQRKLNTFHFREGFLYILIAFVVSSLWYLPETIANGFWFIKTFLDYQIGLALRSADSAHEQPFWYHPLVLLVGVFPASIYFLGNYSKDKETSNLQSLFRVWMKIFFWVVLIVFSIVKAKILHYSSLCYFPITFFAADYIYRVSESKINYKKWLTPLFLVIGTLIALLLIVVPFVPIFKDKLIPYIDDKFAVANLDAEVYWSGFEALVGVFFLCSVWISLMIIRKKSVYKSAIFLFISVIITFQLTVTIYVPKIEPYTQGAAIEFFKKVQKEDAYIITLNYRSYAHYYYGEITQKQSDERTKYLQKYFKKKDILKIPKGERETHWRDHLLYDKVDKPVYFITHIDRVDPKQTKHLKKLYEKNGFVFYKKEK